MGNQTIHELSLSTVLSKSFNLVQLSSGGLGNSNNYRLINNVFYPEVSILFPNKELVLNISSPSTNVKSLPIIFYCSDTEFSSNYTSYTVSVVYSTDKNFNFIFSFSNSDIFKFTQSQNPYIYYVYGAPFFNGFKNRTTWTNLSSVEKTYSFNTIYLMFQLIKKSGGSSGNFTKPFSFSVSYKKTKIVGKGFIFPNINTPVEGFDPDGMYFDGSVYYGF